MLCLRHPRPLLCKFLLLFLILHHPHPLTAQCHNHCSNNGICNTQSRCECASGFQAGDCSSRTCPHNIAFSDFSTASPHSSTECSGRGICDRVTGTCACMAGFSGIACERTLCADSCNYRGMCISYSQMASTTRNANSEIFRYDTVWDADKIYGCVCDEGYVGHDCSVRVCSTGDDPLTTGGVQEVQLMKCTATLGNFVLYFRGKVSGTISFSDSALNLKAEIESIHGIGRVSITFSHGTTACNDVLNNIVSISFLDLFGPLPPLVAEEIDMNAAAVIQIGADATTGSMTDNDGNVITNVKGDKENDHCSNRGLCDDNTGTCKCFESTLLKYASSDGYGASGDRGDCGYAITTITDCPGVTPCSGHGVCDTSTFRCLCEEEFRGGDCSERTCKSGLSWFSYPSQDNVGHDEWVECSGMGICDRMRGECLCNKGYFGAACDNMGCPGTTMTCNGHGTCMSIKSVALTQSIADPTLRYGYDPNDATTWDADRIFGCFCDTGYEGHDCSLKSCPSGIDPLDNTSVNEVCSNHGICDHDTGECGCFNGRGDSDGAGTGNKGFISDCGHRLLISRTSNSVYYGRNHGH